MLSLQSLVQLHSLVTSHVRPTIMVASSTEANAIAAKNHLTLAQLLQPFGAGVHSNPGMQAFSFQPLEQRCTIRNFGVRFTAVDQARELPGADVDAYLEKCLADSFGALSNVEEQRLLQASVRERADVEPFLNGITNPAPWFTAYRQEFLECLRFNEDEMIDQPTTCIVVVSSSDADPLGEFERLSRQRILPPSFQNGSFDTNVYRFYVLLHDNHLPPEALDRAHAIMRDLKKAHSATSSRMLCINSLPLSGAASVFGAPPPAQPPTDIWRPYVRSVFHPEPIDQHVAAPVVSAAVANDPLTASAAVDPMAHRRGRFLSADDLAACNSVVLEVASKGLLPHLEKKMRFLHSQVATQRKGFGNRLKAMFGRKTREGGKYELNSIEAQTRQLADLAMLTQDYALAVELYNMCVADCRQDKLGRPLASALELLSLAMLMQAAQMVQLSSNVNLKHDAAVQLMINFNSHLPRRELESHLESAFASHIAAGDARRATRCALWAADILALLPPRSAQNHVRETTQFLLRASERESNARAALLLEQAAFAYLAGAPAAAVGMDSTPGNEPAVRKYAFHLIMAGHLFAKCNQRKHSVRCYRRAMVVYADKQWYHIEDHVNFILGRQSFSLGDLQAAIDFFLQLVATGRQSIERQNTFLREFIFVLKKWSTKPTGDAEADNEQASLVLKTLSTLGLPAFNDSSIQLPFASISESSRQGRTMFPAAANSLWNKIASLSGYSAGTAAGISEAEEAAAAVTAIVSKEPRRAPRPVVVGEPITLVVKLTNPLAVRVDVQNLRLRCAHAATGAPNAAVDDCSNGAFEVDEQQVSLAPNSTTSVELRVTPLQAGALHIQAFTWQLFGLVRGVHTINLPGRRLTATVEQRADAQYAPDLSLQFEVLPAAPLLSVSLTSPDAEDDMQMLHGELRFLQLQLHNSGRVPIEQCAIKCINAQFALLGAPTADASAVPDMFASHSTVIPWNQCDTVTIAGPNSPCSLFPLLPGASCFVPVYVRAATPGTHRVDLLVRFGTTDNSVDHRLRSRLAHVALRRAHVLPTLSASSFTRPSFFRLADHVLGVEIENALNTSALGQDAQASAVCVQQIVALSPNWRIATLGQSEPVAQLIATGDVSTQYLTLAPVVAASRLIEAASTLKSETTPLENPPVSQFASSSGTKFFVSSTATGDSTIDFAQWPLSHFLRAERTSICQATSASAAGTAPPAYGAASGSVPIALETYGGDHIDLLVVWRCDTSSATGTRQRFGVHHMLKVPFRSAAPPASCPLKLTVHCPQSASLVVASPARPLRVPICVRVRNATEAAPVSFSFETLPTDEEFDQATRSFRVRSSALSGGRYFWEGVSRRRVVALPPGGVMELPLTAVILAPGSYNINRFRFNLEVEGAAPRVFFFPLQHWLHVHASGVDTATPVELPTLDRMIEDATQWIASIEAVAEQELQA